MQMVHMNIGGYESYGKVKEILPIQNGDIIIDTNQKAYLPKVHLENSLRIHEPDYPPSMFDLDGKIDK